MLIYFGYRPSLCVAKSDLTSAVLIKCSSACTICLTVKLFFDEIECYIKAVLKQAGDVP